MSTRITHTLSQPIDRRSTRASPLLVPRALYFSLLQPFALNRACASTNTTLLSSVTPSTSLMVNSCVRLVHWIGYSRKKRTTALAVTGYVSPTSTDFQLKSFSTYQHENYTNIIAAVLYIKKTTLKSCILIYLCERIDAFLHYSEFSPSSIVVTVNGYCKGFFTIDVSIANSNKTLLSYYIPTLCSYTQKTFQFLKL